MLVEWGEVCGQIDSQLLRDLTPSAHWTPGTMVPLGRQTRHSVPPLGWCGPSEEYMDQGATNGWILVGPLEWGPLSHA